MEDGDYFFQLLPASNAIRSMNLAAARASLGNEPTFTSAVGATTSEARLQCAALSCVMGPSYSLAADKALPAAVRTYLITNFGLPAQPCSGRAAAQAGRIDAHGTTHHPKLADGSLCGGGNTHGGRPGGGAAGAADAACVASAAGAPPGDDTGGFAPALLPAFQTAALFKIPRAELWKLLDAAGVPHSPATADADLRTKCAAAAWATEKLRSAGEFHALPDGVKDSMLNAFKVPAAWRLEARHQALLTLLHACRNAPWALNPSLSHWLVNRERSKLFLLEEQFAAEPRSGGATPSQLLSPQEYD